MFLPLDRRNTKLLMSKNQILIFFVGVNENSTTFLYTFEKGGQENVFYKCITKSKCQQQKFVFSF